MEERDWVLEQFGLKQTVEEEREELIERKLKQLKSKAKRMNRLSESMVDTIEELEDLKY